MAELNPERNLRIVLIVSAAALVTGAVTGGLGFALLAGEEHLWLGLRTGALLSQTLVWGSVILVGLGHWVYEGYQALKSGRKPSAAELTLSVDPSQIERPLTGQEASGEVPVGSVTKLAATRTGRYEEVSV